MNGMYIEYYSNDVCEPLKSIMQLEEVEAFKLAQELSDKYEGTSFGRFEDFHVYYPKRKRTEEWLYNKFRGIGGRPEVEHPYYFVLHQSSYLHNWFDNKRKIRLQLDSISSKDISFTIGDSMAQMDKDSKRDPITKEDLFEMINRYENIDDFLESLDVNYIEAQLWSNKYNLRWLQE